MHCHHLHPVVRGGRLWTRRMWWLVRHVRDRHGVFHHQDVRLRSQLRREDLRPGRLWRKLRLVLVPPGLQPGGKLRVCALL